MRVQWRPEPGSGMLSIVYFITLNLGEFVFSGRIPVSCISAEAQDSLPLSSCMPGNVRIQELRLKDSDSIPLQGDLPIQKISNHCTLPPSHYQQKTITISGQLEK
jgi:hypothetical protein